MLNVRSIASQLGKEGVKVSKVTWPAPTMTGYIDIEGGAQVVVDEDGLTLNKDGKSFENVTVNQIAVVMLPGDKILDKIDEEIKTLKQATDLLKPLGDCHIALKKVMHWMIEGKLVASSIGSGQLKEYTMLLTEIQAALARTEGALKCPTHKG